MQGTCCVIAAALTAGMLASSIAVASEQQHNKPRARDDEVSKRIREMRKRIAYRATVAGAVAAVVSQAIARDWCTSWAAFIVVLTVVYILSPKEEWTVVHLATMQERKAWVDAYARIQRAYVLGALAGAAAAMAAMRSCVAPPVGLFAGARPHALTA